jgi:predicted DCC family thiol-disulfide oxidoreductase YuxK
MSAATIMDHKPNTTHTQPEAEFPPFSLCGSVPLWHIHNRAKLATAQLANDSVAAAMPPLLVYDGSCGFCSRAVQFILRHERRHDLLFVPRDSTLGKDLRRDFHLETVESMLWIADCRAAIESGAVLSAAKYLGGVWSALASLGLLIPPTLRNWAYRLIARNRRRLSGGVQACLVPTSEQRARFLG